MSLFANNKRHNVKKLEIGVYGHCRQLTIIDYLTSPYPRGSWLNEDRKNKLLLITRYNRLGTEKHHPNYCSAGVLDISMTVQVLVISHYTDPRSHCLYDTPGEATDDINNI